MDDDYDQISYFNFFFLKRRFWTGDIQDGAVLLQLHPISLSLNLFSLCDDEDDHHQRRRRRRSRR
jgi:hypothetical protein